jgi:hypothetical protein
MQEAVQNTRDWPGRRLAHVAALTVFVTSKTWNSHEKIL